MQRLSFATLALIAAASFALPAPGLAATTDLKVDFQITGATTEPGFTPLEGGVVTGTPVSAGPVNGYTVQVSGQTGFFERTPLMVDGGGLTLAQIYNDFVYHNGGGTLRVDISGVTPNQPYVIKWYSFDKEPVVVSTTRYLPTAATATTGSSVDLSYNGSVVPTSDNTYAATGVWTSTSTTLSIDADIISGVFNRVNGFELYKLNAPFLAVDFQGTGAQTETGFVAFEGPIIMAANATINNNYVTPEGLINVNVKPAAGQTLGFFNRDGVINDAGSFTHSELLEDFVYNNAGGTMTFEISGLQANTPYVITWFAHDPENSVSSLTQFLATPASATTGSVGQILYGGITPPTSNSQFAFTGIWQSTTGTLSIDADILSGSFNRVSGFSITRLNEAATVPEPATAVLGLAALAALAARRKRVA